MSTTVLAGAAEAPAAGRPDAPTARLLLPSDAPREEWLATRRAGIGGSDVAAILGLDRWKSPRHVYEEKHGREEPDNTAMRFGRRMESVIADEFADETGLTVTTPPGMFVNVDRPWQFANVDRFVLDDHGVVVAPLECKNRSEYQADDWKEGTPDAPAIQAHWYTATGGWSHAYVAAAIGGNRLVWWRLERDEEIVEWLVDHCEKWWQKHVVEGYPPDADGLQATTDLLAKLWDVKPEKVAEVELSPARTLRKRRAELKAQEKALQEDLRAVENEMRLVTGDGEIARAGSKTAWTNKANGTFASSRFREAEPELAAEYTRLSPVVDTERLAAEHPDVYRRYRARVLRVPSKEI